MKIENLEKCFYEASKQNKKYVGVKIQMQGFSKPEIIINENEDLTLKTFNGIRIVGFTYGDSFKDIEEDLID